MDRTILKIIFLLCFSAHLIGQSRLPINVQQQIDALFSEVGEEQPGYALGIFKDTSFNGEKR